MTHREIFFLIGIIVGACGVEMVRAAHGQEIPQSGSTGVLTATTTKTGSDTITVHFGDGKQVVLRPDGTVEYVGGYTPDEAAAAFWKAVAGAWGCK